MLPHTLSDARLSLPPLCFPVSALFVCARHSLSRWLSLRPPILPPSLSRLRRGWAYLLSGPTVGFFSGLCRSDASLCVCVCVCAAFCVSPLPLLIRHRPTYPRHALAPSSKGKKKRERRERKKGGNGENERLRGACVTCRRTHSGGRNRKKMDAKQRKEQAEREREKA